MTDEEFFVKLSQDQGEVINTLMKKVMFLYLQLKIEQAETRRLQNVSAENKALWSVLVPLVMLDETGRLDQLQEVVSEYINGGDGIDG